MHTESDLRAYLCWCAERGLDPLAAARPHIELYVRWMQEQRRYAASTTSQRMAVVAGFYRTCVIDGTLEHSPAEYVRRPNVPAQSPTLGLSHLQFGAMLTAARASTNLNDFALVCLLGLLGLRIFEATGLDISDLGEEHGHRVLRVVGNGHKILLVPMPPAVARAIDRGGVSGISLTVAGSGQKGPGALSLWLQHVLDGHQRFFMNAPTPTESRNCFRAWLMACALRK